MSLVIDNVVARCGPNLQGCLIVCVLGILSERESAAVLLIYCNTRKLQQNWGVLVCMYSVCVCVCERERERGRGTKDK